VSADAQDPSAASLPTTLLSLVTDLDRLGVVYFDDAVSVAASQRSHLDRDYLEDVAARLGLSAELGWVLDAATDPDPG
jgi:hypothetical protein